jgi:hypothetical protein
MRMHVYCTECKYGEQLIESIFDNNNIPTECEDCYPYDPEDSRDISLRKNYQEK